MSPVDLGVCVPERGFPRVSGDEPPSWNSLINHEVFSPRERG